MRAFGWREDRSEPLTEREAATTVLQPGMLANGVLGTWITRLSPYSDLTRLAVEATSPEALVGELTLRFLGREPAEAESEAFSNLLEEGFSTRLVEPVSKFQKQLFIPDVREVTWSNHLSPEANIYAADVASKAALGPPATALLAADWRARMEDLVWALINSPEMTFVP